MGQDTTKPAVSTSAVVASIHGPHSVITEKVLGDNEDFFEFGYVSSSPALELVTYVERRFNVVVEVSELDLESFRMMAESLSLRGGSAPPRTSSVGGRDLPGLLRPSDGAAEHCGPDRAGHRAGLAAGAARAPGRPVVRTVPAARRAGRSGPPRPEVWSGLPSVPGADRR